MCCVYIMASAPVHCVALVRFANLGDECAYRVFTELCRCHRNKETFKLTILFLYF